MSADVVFLRLPPRDLNQLKFDFAAQRQAFMNNPSPSLAERRGWLKALRELLVSQQDALVAAIHQDFGQRSADETRLAELLPCVQAIRHTSRHLKAWMKPSSRGVAMAFQPASAKVIYQPLGVVGVIVPWNYPLLLAIGPLAGALAAGNRIMLKMSESTPATGQLLKTLLARIFPENLVSVVLGQADVAIAFSQLPFNHLVFTGATHIGRQVMQAASQNLTPVTLELGGKSPAIIAVDALMAEAAERIAFGKTLNAGQTCVAPDYVLVPRARIDEFSETYRQAVRRFYPMLVGNPDYSHIANKAQFDRLCRCLQDASAKGANIVALYPLEENRGRCLAPVLILNTQEDMLVMQQEIFGPLLPVIPYDHIEQAISYINQRPRALALYYFGYDKAEQQRILFQTHSGSVCINDTLLQTVQDDLPFGGIGASGMGQYHGREGFLTFSKARSVLIKGRLNPLRWIYPPYGKTLHKWIYRWLIR